MDSGDGMTSKKVRTSTVRSAGGVVVRHGKDGLLALLIATHSGRRWSLPKGRIEPGETPADAAAREVQEETGIEARVVTPLETVDYWFYTGRNQRLHKFVDYFLMAYVTGEPTPQLEEVDDARWWPIGAALRRVAYKNDRRLLRKARHHWKSAEGRRPGNPVE